jgi:hypothetical protein
MNPDKIEKIKQGGSLITLGGPLTDTSVKLCIYADNIDLATLTSCIGVEPTEMVRRGEVIGNRRPSPTGYWFLEAPEDLPFEEKLQYLLEVTTGDKTVWDNLILGHTVQLRCALYLHTFSEGFDLPADVIAEIGNRHWAFGLSVYSAEGDEMLDAVISDQLREEISKKNQEGPTN